MSILKKAAIVALACLMCLSCCSCAGRTPDAEKAMENFVSKLEAGNYTLEGSDFLQISVASPEEVCFEFADETLDDYAVFTLNGETFQGTLSEDAVQDVVFLSMEDAIHTAESSLPNSWIGLSDGNMFNLFYNNTEDPLEFISYEDSIKFTLINLAGYGFQALSQMQEVHVKLDKENPTEAHITDVIEDNEVTRMYFDDIDFTIRFGKAKSDPRIEAWRKSPVYPAARTAWMDDDLFYLNSVFLPGYGADAVPFPEFSSYTLTFDEEVFNSYEQIRLTDSHASLNDVSRYIDLLNQNGYTESIEQTDDGGSVTVYRKLLRESTGCYVSLRPYYENGLVLEAKRYYDAPAYDSLGEINAVLGSNGFAELADSDHLSGWNAVDAANERTESWLFFFQYDMSLVITAEYDDAEALNDYLEEYGGRLSDIGYSPSDPNSAEEERAVDRWESVSSGSVFTYTDNGDGTVILQFWNEKVITPEEAASMISEAGIPSVLLEGDVLFRDLSKYHFYTRAFAGQLYLNASVPFDSEEEAESFLNNYVAALEADGFERTNPESIGSLKQNAYYNEEKDKYVAFDFLPEVDGVSVNLNFVSN